MPAEQQPGSDPGPTGPSRSRQGGVGVPDGLLVSALALLLGLTLLTWTATGLAGLLSKGAWPQGVEFTHTPLAMRELVTDPRDLPGAWPNTPPEALSGPGLFWGLFLGHLMVLVVLTVFVLGVVARARALYAARRAEREAALRARIAAERAARERAASERAAREAALGKKAGFLRKRRRADGPSPSTSAPHPETDERASPDGPITPEKPTANPAISGHRSEQRPASPPTPGGPTGQPSQPVNPRSGPQERLAPSAQSPSPVDEPEWQPRAEQHPRTDGADTAPPPNGSRSDGGSPAPVSGTEATEGPNGSRFDAGYPQRQASPERPGVPDSSSAGSVDTAARSVIPLPTQSPAHAGTRDGSHNDAHNKIHTPASAAGPATSGPDGTGTSGGVVTAADSPEASADRIREAPGAALVATPDPRLWADTKDARAKLGPVHLYDPTHSCDTPNRLSWSPLHGCADRATAAARSTALLEPLRSRRPIDATTHTTAETVLRCWLHAAALEDRPARELHRWALAMAAGTAQSASNGPSTGLAQRTFGRAANRPSSADPVRILRGHPKAAPGAAGELEAVLTGHPQLRQEAIGLIHRALSPFEQLHIRNACTPSRADRLALESFLDETGTLYVVGSEAEAMPLLHALTQSVLERGRRRAARSSGGPIDPPLTTVLELDTGGRFH